MLMFAVAAIEELKSNIEIIVMDFSWTKVLLKSGGNERLSVRSY
jgi:hypothetical protein